MLDHAAREPRVALDLRGNGVQRVEKKVRMQLHAQRIQASFGKLPFQAFAAQFAREVALIVTVGLPCAYDDPVDEPVPEEHAAQSVRKKVRIAEYRPRS